MHYALPHSDKYLHVITPWALVATACAATLLAPLVFPVMMSLGAQVAIAPCSVDKASGDAWWTGPMLANSAATLPAGHILAEPYIYDVRASSSYDDNGRRRPATPTNSYGSLTYIIYGVTDRLSAGAVPTFGINTISGSSRSTGIHAGDLSVQAQFRLTSPTACRSRPTISVSLQESLPIGQYDKLGDRPANGFGSGAYATTLAVYSQTYFKLRNDRILRVRVNVSGTVSRNADVVGASVYGTDGLFRGLASPGAGISTDVAVEYSVTRRWVLALDLIQRHAWDTRISGSETSAPSSSISTIVMHSGPSDAFGLAPALEYNLNSNMGILFGTRVIAAGRNTAASVTPAIAVNLVH